MIIVEESNKKTYEKNMEKHDCGYWDVCYDHACPCSIDKNVDGFDNKVYQSMKEELQNQAETMNW